jgi:hypothetical protein
MKKYRLSTTISPKHWSLLQKYSEKFETQQKAIEKALEQLDSRPLDMRLLSDEDKIWVRIGRELGPVVLVFSKDFYKTIIVNVDPADIQKFVDQQKPTEFAIEFFYQKLLSACSQKEMIDGLLVYSKLGGFGDAVTCTETGDCYDIYLTHTYGINHSKTVLMMYESALNTYGARFESGFSERTVFFKIYKNDNANGTPGKEAGAANPLAK